MANTNQDLQLSDSDRNRIKALWDQAIEPIGPPQEQTTAQALGFGINFRVDLGRALVAALETGQVVASATAAIHDPMNIFAWFGVGAEFVAACGSIFASLVQRMRPIDYVTCVVLAKHSQGLTKSELQKSVEEFLEDPKSAQFSWYLGLNEGLIRRAREVLAAKDWLSEVLTQLRKEHFLDEGDAGILKFKSQHYSIGWKRA
jgi:hypothetical protein